METRQEAEGELSLEEIRDRLREYVKQASDAQVWISAFYDYFQWESLNAGPEYKNASDYLCRHIPGLTREELSWYENSSKGTGRSMSWVSFTRAWTLVRASSALASSKPKNLSSFPRSFWSENIEAAF